MSCPLCNEPSIQGRGAQSADATHFDCSQCGRFSIDGIVDQLGTLQTDGVIRRRMHLLRAYIREASSRVMVDHALLATLRDGRIRERTLEEKIGLAMRWCVDRSTTIGAPIPITKDNSDFLVAWCRDSDEWLALLDLIIEGPRLLCYVQPELKERGDGVRITYEGWSWLRERPRNDGNLGFIAMSFDPTLSALSEAIREGIEQAGYSPFRIDGDDFTGGIMDKILARIRESHFVVSDFKGNRGGVYYEAGFALGLGVPVFMLCADGQLDPTSPERVHFDVAHQNILAWNANDLPGLTTRLRDRILAVLGRGPMKV